MVTAEEVSDSRRCTFPVWTLEPLALQKWLEVLLNLVSLSFLGDDVSAFPCIFFFSLFSLPAVDLKIFLGSLGGVQSLDMC